MGHHFDAKGYLSVLLGRPRARLSSRDWQFLFQFIEGPEWIYSMDKSVNRVYEFDSEDRGEVATVRFTRKSLSRTAVRKRLAKLEEDGLIEPLDKKSLSYWEDFEIRKKHVMPYQITEKGLFCVLSQAMEYPVGMLTRHWQSMVIGTLLSRYFEKKTMKHTTPELHFTIVQFLHESCEITVKALDAIKQEDNDDAEDRLRERATKLEKDLDWHAKSFALRLLIETGSKDRERAGKTWRILTQLLHDRKFSKLLQDTTHVVQSSYRGLTAQKKAAVAPPRPS